MDYTKFVPLTALVSARKDGLAEEAKAQAEEEVRKDAAHQSLTMFVTAMAIDCLSETLCVHRHDIAEIIEVLDWRDQWGGWEPSRQTFESPYGTIDLPQKITVKFLVGRVAFYTDLFYRWENTAPYYKLTKGAEPFSAFGRWPEKFSSFTDAVIWAQQRTESILEEERQETERDAKHTTTREVQQRAKQDERDALLDALGDDPIAIHLLKLFLAVQRERENYEDSIYTLTEGWDRTAADAAATSGDLLAEVEQVNVTLSQERAGRQYAEDELYAERRKHKRSR